MGYRGSSSVWRGSVKSVRKKVRPKRATALGGNVETVWYSYLHPNASLTFPPSWVATYPHCVARIYNLTFPPWVASYPNCGTHLL